MDPSRPAILSAARAGAADPIIHLNALGMSVRIRVPAMPRGKSPVVFETMNSAKSGSPQLRRAEGEIFHILSGRFIFEVDGRRFVARKGDIVVVPGGAIRSYTNVTGTGARQQVIMHPGIDIDAFYRELAQATNTIEDVSDIDLDARLQRLSRRWDVEFFGPPPSPDGHQDDSLLLHD